MLKISLNDQWIELQESALDRAIATWNYEPGKCAVAINGEFVPRSDYDKTQLHDGDKVDVVAPVGGG